MHPLWPMIASHMRIASLHDTKSIPWSTLIDQSFRTWLLLTNYIFMHSASFFGAFGLFLTLSRSAILTPHGSSSSLSIAQPADPTSLSALNTSILSASGRPWGPDTFSFRVAPSRFSTTAMDPLDTYMFVIYLIAKLAPNDWEDRLPDAVVNFKNSQLPDLTLLATATSQRTRLPQRYLLWGLAHVMNLLTRNGFVSGTYDLLVQGRRVGGFSLFSGPFVPPLAGTVNVVSTTYTAVTPASSTQNSTLTATVGDTEITWTHEFRSNLMTPANILMPAIGSLIMAAEENGYTPQNPFLGSFRPYTAIFSYLPRSSSIAFTKMVCVDTIVDQVTYAWLHSNWHEQKTMVMNGTELIASGGYFPWPRESLMNT